MERLIENIICKDSIENHYLDVMNHICDRLVQNGNIREYINEMEYDPYHETLNVKTSVIFNKSLDYITVTLTPELLQGNIEDVIENLNKDIEQEYGN